MAVPHIITMGDMEALFSVTDRFGINREAITVPLEKSDVGSVVKKGVTLEITVPESIAIDCFEDIVRHRLLELGYVCAEVEDR